LHPSYLQILELPEQEAGAALAIAPEVSEWLFHAGVWKSLNAKCGTNFGQFEDDVLLKSIVPEAMDLLFAAKDRIDSDGEMTRYRFAYAWSKDGKEQICDISKEDLTIGLLAIIYFLNRAIELASDVYCQL
jgi:hypothetical protein